MFAYCRNNPQMFFDCNGLAPKPWQWIVSGALIVGGSILTATGIGGPLGGAMICAGTNSIIGSYASEASGGSSTAGWYGGIVSGAISGFGAGLGGNFLTCATNSTGLSCLGLLSIGTTVSYISGYWGDKSWFVSDS